MIARATLLALCGLAMCAIPVSATTNEALAPISTSDTPFGSLTFYGAPPGPAPAGISPLDCGAGDQKCDSKHVPPVLACVGLIAYLNATSQFGISPSSRAVCISLNGGQCCASWASVVPLLTNGDLVPSATGTLNVCVVNGFSGETVQTLLHGVCTTQCLSDRPNGCG